MDNYLRAIDRKIDVCGKLMLRNSNIVAVGRGNKTINGEMIKNRPTLTVFVEKKLANSAIEESQRIPKYIGGIETDVYEEKIDSKLEKLSDVNMITDLIPALGGGSIAALRRLGPTFGTLTYGFVNKGSRKKLYGLSSGHVFLYQWDDPMKPGGTVVYFRGYDDKGPDGQGYKKAWKLGTFVNAKTKQYVENDIDAALIFVGDNNLENKKLIAPGLVTGKIITNTHVVTQADINNKEQVYIVGMVTGYIEGRILTIKTMQKVYGSNGKDVIIAKNQIRTNIQCNDGDSGSLGVMKGTQEAFGMLNAGEGKISAFSEIDTVLKAFNLEFLT